MERGELLITDELIFLRLRMLRDNLPLDNHYELDDGGIVRKSTIDGWIGLWNNYSPDSQNAVMQIANKVWKGIRK